MSSDGDGRSSNLNLETIPEDRYIIPVTFLSNNVLDRFFNFDQNF